MHFSLKFILLTILAVIVVMLLWDGVRAYVLVQKSGVLVKEATPFERDMPNAKMNILVLGDSTAYGTGAETPEVSTAGRLGALYPQASVTNLAVNGLRLAGLLQIISTLNAKEHFSIILVQIGANDILRFTPMSDVQRNANEMFAELSQKTDMLVVLHSGDVGEAPIFPWYVKPILSYRSYEMRAIYQKLATAYGAHYVDLISAPSSKLMQQNPKLYYAADMLHLTGAGYGLWFEGIQKALK